MQSYWMKFILEQTPFAKEIFVHLGLITKPAKV
jgi:hypothetical protein